MSQPLTEQVAAIAAKVNAKVTQPRKGRMIIDVQQTAVREFISSVVNNVKVLSLSTISGVDVGDRIEIIYHFWNDEDSVNVKTAVPKNSSNAVSIVDLLPGAVLYEMEIHDMFGVVFTGNPWMDRKLLLPDTWPSDLPPPLLKSSKPADIRRRLNLEVEPK